MTAPIMTEKDFDPTQLITQIEDMLKSVSGHQTVPAAEMQDGLLDLLNLAHPKDV